MPRPRALRAPGGSRKRMPVTAQMRKATAITASTAKLSCARVIADRLSSSGLASTVPVRSKRA